jgi:uncharacterized membrane protein YraQ (UPF0718 family)
MRRLIPLLAIVGIVAVVALRSWTSDNLAPFRGQVQDVITLALSLLIESLPFIVLGIALSIVVQVFVPTSWLESWLPENPFARRAIVSLFGMFLPVCECGNVPLARGLLGRGYGVGDSVTFLFAAPIVNPVTIITTHQAFGFDDGILVWRLLAGYLIANLLGWLFSRHPNPRELLTTRFVRECALPVSQRGGTRWEKVGSLFVSESTALMPALIVGALIAGVIQVGVSREVLLALGTDPIISVLALIMLAFVISVCANVDAFFILPFAQTFLPGSIVAFLVFGPLIDIKMVALLRTTFTGRTITLMAAVVGLCSLALGMVINSVG